VELEVIAPECGGGPGRILQESLPTKFIGHAEPFERTKARDALAPVLGLAVASRLPVPGDELVNAPRDHADILLGNFRAGISGPHETRW
jgi:hypothetical protein